MKLNELSDFIKEASLPFISIGVMSLFACDILTQLYMTGKVSDTMEKELLMLISSILTAHSMSNKQ